MSGGKKCVYRIQDAHWIIRFHGWCIYRHLLNVLYLTYFGRAKHNWNETSTNIVVRSSNEIQQNAGQEIRSHWNCKRISKFKWRSGSIRRITLKVFVSHEEAWRAKGVKLEGKRPYFHQHQQENISHQPNWHAIIYSWLMTHVPSVDSRFDWPIISANAFTFCEGSLMSAFRAFPPSSVKSETFDLRFSAEKPSIEFNK